MSKVSEALQLCISVLDDRGEGATSDDHFGAAQTAREAFPLAIAQEQELKTLRAEVARLRYLLEPGTAPAIVEGMFDLAEKECGHSPAGFRHALTTIREWIETQKAEVARLSNVERDLAEGVRQNLLLLAERARLREALELTKRLPAPWMSHLLPAAEWIDILRKVDAALHPAPEAQ